MPSPPPLPENLSTRLQATVDPRTGRCKHHPDIKLCVLAGGGTRWSVRRKTCYMCGARSAVAVPGSRHRAGKAVKATKPREEARGREAPGRGADGGRGARGRSAAPTTSNKGGRHGDDPVRSRSGPRRRSVAATPRPRVTQAQAPLLLDAGPAADSIPPAPVPPDDGALVLYAPPPRGDGRGPAAEPDEARRPTSRPRPSRSKSRRRRSPRPVEPIVGVNGNGNEPSGPDPLITITVAAAPGGALPPPPPRPPVELARHQSRLDLRQTHLRREPSRRPRRDPEPDPPAAPSPAALRLLEAGPADAGARRGASRPRRRPAGPSRRRSASRELHQSAPAPARRPPSPRRERGGGARGRGADPRIADDPGKGHARSRSRRTGSTHPLSSGSDGSDKEGDGGARGGRDRGGAAADRRRSRRGRGDAGPAAAPRAPAAERASSTLSSASSVDGLSSGDEGERDAGGDGGGRATALGKLQGAARSTRDLMGRSASAIRRQPDLKGAARQWQSALFT